MKKILLFFSVLLLHFTADAQSVNYQGTPNSRAATLGMYGALKGFIAPPSDTVESNAPIGLIKTGSDWKQYIFNGTRWLPLADNASNGGIDSSAVIALLNWNNISGKPTTFAPAAHNHSIANVNGLQDSLDSRARSSALSNYVPASRTISINGTSLDLSSNRSWTIPSTDTSNLSSRIEDRLKYSDTANMLVGYIRANRLTDTALAIRTTLPTKVNYTDTAAMLSPYALKSETYWTLAEDTLKNTSSNFLLENLSSTINSSGAISLTTGDEFNIAAPSGSITLTTPSNINLNGALVSITAGDTQQINAEVNNNGFVVPRLTYEPLGENGAIYYNSTDDKFRAHENGAWVELIGGSAISAATSSEVNTGTDNTEFISPLALQGSKYLDQSGSKVYATTGGVANTYTLTLSPAISAYATGQTFNVIFNIANTSASTININGLGAKQLAKNSGSNLVSGDLIIGKVYILFYNGTVFQVTNVGGQISGSGGPAYSVSPTFTGVPAAPTASAGTSTTQLATTAFVTTAANLKLNIANPTATGTLTAPAVTISSLTAGSVNDSVVTVNAATGVLYRRAFPSSTGSGWGLSGTAGTTAGTNYVGTPDAVDLYFKSNNKTFLYGSQNHGLAGGLGASVSGGVSPVALGYDCYATGASTASGVACRAEASYSAAYGINARVQHQNSVVIAGTYGTNAFSIGEGRFKTVFPNGQQFNSSDATIRLEIKASGIINITNTPTYADNTAALAGGLVAGDIYRTSTGVLMIVY